LRAVAAHHIMMAVLRFVFHAVEKSKCLNACSRSGHTDGDQDQVVIHPKNRTRLWNAHKGPQLIVVSMWGVLDMEETAHLSEKIPNNIDVHPGVPHTETVST
jgi:hypothetical protein